MPKPRPSPDAVYLSELEQSRFACSVLPRWQRQLAASRTDGMAVHSAVWARQVNDRQSGPVDGRDITPVAGRQRLRSDVGGMISAPPVVRRRTPPPKIAVPDEIRSSRRPLDAPVGRTCRALARVGPILSS